MPSLFLSFPNEHLTCDLNEEPFPGTVTSSRASSLRRSAAAPALPHMRASTPLQAQGMHSEIFRQQCCRRKATLHMQQHASQ